MPLAWIVEETVTVFEEIEDLEVSEFTARFEDVIRVEEDVEVEVGGI